MMAGFIFPILFVAIYLSCLVASQTEVCRFGDDPDCVFPCLCTNGCDRTNGDCLNGGVCNLEEPSQAGIRRSGDGCKIENIALEKPAYQSGTEDGKVASLAVDGSVSDDPDQCTEAVQRIAHPFRAWWYVDLQGYYQVTSVTLFNRRNEGSFPAHKRLGGLRLGVDTTADPNQTELCNYYVGPVPESGNVTVQCTLTLTGRYVTIIRGKAGVVAESHYMHICEVMVHGYKLIDCARCPTGVSCNPVSGCLACAPGFLYPDCVTGCPNGRFGPNCLYECSGNCAAGLVTSQVCYSSNGTCTSGCKTPPYQTWYHGDTCDQQIPYVEVGQSLIQGVSSVTHHRINLMVSGFQNIPIPGSSSQFYGTRVYISVNKDTMVTNTGHWNDTFPWQDRLTIDRLEPDTTYFIQISILRRKPDGSVEESKDRTTVIHTTTSPSPTEQPTTYTSKPVTSPSSTTMPVTSPTSTWKSEEVGGIAVPLIAVSATGGVFLIALVVILGVFLRKCRLKQRQKHSTPSGGDGQIEIRSPTYDEDNKHQNKEQVVYETPNIPKIYENEVTDSPDTHMYAGLQPADVYEEINLGDDQSGGVYQNETAEAGRPHVDQSNISHRQIFTK